jgi:stage IV sporulation protein FB
MYNTLEVNNNMHFKLFNIPIYIQPTFWIFLIFFTNIYRNPSVYSLILGLVLIVSLIVHELGHAMTAQYYGAYPHIILEAFGGRAEYEGRGISSREAFHITLNGPLLESLLIPLSYFLLKWSIFEGHPYIQYFLYATMRFNILWCLLNLIPVSPLDGGHLVQYLLEKKFKDKGAQVTLVIGLICVVLVAPYLYFKGLFFFGTLLLIFGYQNYQVLKRHRGLLADNPFKRYLQGEEALKNNDLDKAKKLLKKLVKSQDSHIKTLSTESLAKVYCQERDGNNAYELLLDADYDLLKGGKSLLCKLAFERENYNLVAQYSRDVYEQEPSFEIAILNSKAFAHLNQLDLAIGWLETACLFGEEYREKVEEHLCDPVYDLIKMHTDFKCLVEKFLSSESFIETKNESV